MARFLLLHSPLVGPLTLKPLRDALARRGHEAAVPDLRGTTHSAGSDLPLLEGLAGEALSTMTSNTALIIAGHSGASAYLPVLSAALDPQGLVLIDAVVPPPDGSFNPSGGFRAALDGLVEPDGHLPPWPQWWTEDQLSQLVPDPHLRAGIVRECPRLSTSFYDTALDVPENWSDRRVAYLQLSAAYDPEAAHAAERGWPVRRRAGGHLDTATRPDDVAAAIVDLLAPVLDADG